MIDAFQADTADPVAKAGEKAGMIYVILPAYNEQVTIRPTLGASLVGGGHRGADPMRCWSTTAARIATLDDAEPLLGQRRST